MLKTPQNLRRFFYLDLFTKYTPNKIINAEKNWIADIFSPSKIPQFIATIGIKYVTEDEKIGVDIWINLLNIILAKPVPITANIVM